MSDDKCEICTQVSSNNPSVDVICGCRFGLPCMIKPKNYPGTIAIDLKFEEHK